MRKAAKTTRKSARLRHEKKKEDSKKKKSTDGSNKGQSVKLSRSKRRSCRNSSSNTKLVPRSVLRSKRKQSGDGEDIERVKETSARVNERPHNNDNRATTSGQKRDENLKRRKRSKSGKSRKRKNEKDQVSSSVAIVTQAEHFDRVAYSVTAAIQSQKRNKNKDDNSVFNNMSNLSTTISSLRNSDSERKQHAKSFANLIKRGMECTRALRILDPKRRKMDDTFSKKRKDVHSEDMEDNDIQILHSTLSNPLMSYPHSRHSCAVHPFSIDGKGRSNHVFCSNCYCFVCDDLASKCSRWKGRDGHCNAHDKAERWAEKRAKRKGLATKPRLQLPADTEVIDLT